MVYVMTLCLAMAAGGVVYFLSYPWLMIVRLKALHSSEHPTIVLDDAGVELMRLSRERSTEIAFNAIPDLIKNAFIATEDRDFYLHKGISLMGIVRSLLYNMYYRKFKQGASTITQQLVRLILGDTQKTLWRKIKEQLYALIIERQYSKEHILESYLNNVYFGCGIYGIKSASERFLGKHIEQVTPSEAALLAGIVQSPRLYCPLLEPNNALQRRNVVLYCMEVAGYITSDERLQYQQEPLSITEAVTPRASMVHIRDMIASFIESHFGKEAVYDGGLIIKTTINAAMQRSADRLFYAHIGSWRDATRTSKKPLVDGALISIDEQGGIKALIGGTTLFNRALYARRQIGSTIKPLLYADALSDSSLLQCMIDEPLSIADGPTPWTPSNVTHTFSGEMTLARALMISNNIIMIKLWYILGAERVTQRLRAAGITAPLGPYPSLALGCVDTSPLEVVGMFNVIAHRGIYAQPYCVQWVKNEQGVSLWRHTPVARRVVPWQSSSAVLHLLEQAVERWLYKIGLPALSCAAAGKTGTTNDTRNCWFVGATPNYTTVVYLGADDYSPLGNIYAVRQPFSLWVHFNRAVEQPRTEFTYDPALVSVRIDSFTGRRLAPDEACRSALQVLVPHAA